MPLVPTLVPPHDPGIPCRDDCDGPSSTLIVFSRPDHFNAGTHFVLSTHATFSMPKGVAGTPPRREEPNTTLYVLDMEARNRPCDRHNLLLQYGNQRDTLGPS